MRSRFGYRASIPSVSTAKAVTKQISFKKGWTSYKDNDDVKQDELILAQDARFKKIGRYKTRRGCDRLSVPIGEAIDVQVTSTTGASVQTATTTTYLAQKLTATTSGRVTRAAINVRAPSGAAGTLLVELYSDSSGVPGTRLASSSIRAADIGSSFAYKDVYFIAAPKLTATTAYWLVIRGQASVVGGYEISTTTSSTNAAKSTTSGGTWSTQAYSLNVKLYTSTDGGVKGVFKAYRPSGAKVTLFAHGTSVYSVDESTGVTTAIKTGLNASATDYYFAMVQDAVYWVNGKEKPYKYDFTTVTQVTASPYIPSLLIEHKGLLFFVDADDKTRLYYTNFADYGTFTSTDFIYVPAPKSYDSLIALFKLNGVLYLQANRNKFQLLGSDNATFSLDEAVGQKGTYSQKSVIYDANYAWFASDDGIYQFNGTSEKNIALPFLDKYGEITAKSSCVLELFDNRLYVFYTPNGASDNTECFVYNVLLDVPESIDTRTYIGHTFSRYAQEDIFIQASNRVGALYWGELDTNDHHNLGDIIQWEIRTAHNHFDTPAQLHRIPKWRPSFASASSSYSVQCGYAFDLNDDVTYQDVALGSSGPRYDTGLLFDNGVTFGRLANIEPANLFIPGSHKRIQRVYKHHAAREPVEFDSEILTVQTQRIN